MKEEIKKQIATLKSIIKGISENEAIKNSPKYEQMLNKYLDELSKLLKQLED